MADLRPHIAPLAERLTPRARVYMAVAGLRNLALGVVCILMPEYFTSGSYAGIKGALPFTADTSLIVWGAAFLVAGVIATSAAVFGHETHARIGLMTSVVISGSWVGGFAFAQITGAAAGPTGLIVWAAFTAKDLTMLRDPLRNPFEPLVREVLAGRDRA